MSKKIVLEGTDLAEAQAAIRDLDEACRGFLGFIDPAKEQEALAIVARAGRNVGFLIGVLKAETPEQAVTRLFGRKPEGNA